MTPTRRALDRTPSLQVYSTALSVAQVRRAFFDAQPQGAVWACELAPIPEGSPALHLDYGPFLEALARVSAAKYGAVPGMQLAQQIAGLLDNLVLAITEDAVVHAITDIPAPARLLYRAETSLRLRGESDELFDSWCNCWAQLRLHDLPGYPMWEREVFEVLHKSYAQLCGVFWHHCVGAGEEPSAACAMDGPSFVKFTRDVRALTKALTPATAERMFAEALSEARGGQPARHAAGGHAPGGQGARGSDSWSNWRQTSMRAPPYRPSQPT